MQRYLSNVQFPYCAPSEVATLNKATAYIFTDMQVHDPHITPKNETSLPERNEQDNSSRPQTPRYDIGVIVERISLYQTKRKFCKLSFGTFWFLPSMFINVHLRPQSGTSMPWTVTRPQQRDVALFFSGSTRWLIGAALIVL